MNVSPLIIFEDADLLVINKPADWNTHSPSPFAGEGVYEWLRNREPRWDELAILHRLDKATSGVMVFGKTGAANRSLTEQFTRHTIRKKYQLVTDRPVKEKNLKVVSWLVRDGERYISRTTPILGERAETNFTIESVQAGRTYLTAEPITGRTHQIRGQAAAEGFPILGDVLYGGTSAPRVYLHSRELTLQHPVTNRQMQFTAEIDFEADARLALRQAIIDPGATNAYRLIHGAADGWPGWYVERLGDFLLSQSDHALSEAQQHELKRLEKIVSARGIYHKLLTRQVRRTNVAQASPQWISGDQPTDAFAINENGVKFELSFGEGYSTGIFLDQRDNRRRLLADRVAPKFPVFPQGAAGAEVLNTFAYTCGFSVCTALAGARVTSLDLSKKYLEWGRRNFKLNGMDPAAHDFIYGDAFDWMRRLARKGRWFDLIILDPPTFSQSKEGGAFQAEKDYGKLVTAALPLLKANGLLLASTNAAKVEPDTFVETVFQSIQAGGRKIVQKHFVPQPVDFPIAKAEPGYLKTIWLRVA